MLPEAPLSRTDDRRNLLLALGAAGVTLAVVLGVVGLPAINACSADPRGVVTCLRDMADRKFDLPGRIPGQVAGETASPDVAAPPPAIVVAETEPPAASGGPLEAPAAEPTGGPVETAAVPVPPAEPAALPRTTPATRLDDPSPADAAPAAPQPEPVPAPTLGAAATSGQEPHAIEPAREPEPITPPDDTALSWSTPSAPQDLEEPPAHVPAREAETPAAHSDASIDQPEEPATADPVEAPEPEPSAAAAAQPDAVAPHALASPQAPFVVANAEPASAQPPAPAIAAPVVLAPTIDAIELDGIQSFVSGSGPAGALMRLYADGQLIGESPVEEGRWLVEGSNLLDSPRRELRVEAIEPDTGKLLGVAAITVEIELPDGGAPPDERPEQTPDLGSGVAPAPQADPASPLATSPPTPAQPSSTDPADASAVADNELVIAPAPAAEPADQPTLVDDPEATAPKPARVPQIAAVEPEFEPEPLPPLASVRPQRESASVEILAPSTLQPTTLPPPAAGADDASTITLPVPDTPALIAEFDVPVPAPAVAPGQPVTILRLLPFGDPDEGRYNVGKAIIRRGDTLWSIARRYYGHGIHYRTIFHANRELIRRPSRIFPGQIFDLPLVTDD